MIGQNTVRQDTAQSVCAGRTQDKRAACRTHHGQGHGHQQSRDSSNLPTPPPNCCSNPPNCCSNLQLQQPNTPTYTPTSTPTYTSTHTWKSLTRCDEAAVRMGARNMRACEGYMAPPAFMNLSRASTTAQYKVQTQAGRHRRGEGVRGQVKQGLSILSGCILMGVS